MKYVTTVNGHEYKVEILEDGNITVDGVSYEVDFEEVSGQMVYSMLVNDKSFEAHISEDDDLWQVLMLGTLYNVEVIDEREKRLREAAGEGVEEGGDYILNAPMPGLVIEVPVKKGDEVSLGDVLLILESMKMQNELKSPREGKIKEINVKVGDNVEQKEIILVME